MSIPKKFILYNIRPLLPSTVVVLKLTDNIVVSYIKTDFNKWCLFVKSEINEVSYVIIRDWMKNGEGTCKEDPCKGNY